MATPCVSNDGAVSNPMIRCRYCKWEIINNTCAPHCGEAVYEEQPKQLDYRRSGYYNVSIQVGPDEVTIAHNIGLFDLFLILFTNADSVGMMNITPLYREG